MPETTMQKLAAERDRELTEHFRKERESKAVMKYGLLKVSKSRWVIIKYEGCNHWEDGQYQAHRFSIVSAKLTYVAAVDLLLAALKGEVVPTLEEDE